MASNDARPTPSSEGASMPVSHGDNGIELQALGTPAHSGLRRLVDFFALKRSIVGMLTMVILVGMGEHMGERYLPLYLETLTTGLAVKISLLGVVSIGVLGFLDDFLSALYSFPGGYLSDRLGVRRALLVFNAVSMVGYLIVILVPRWWAVLVGAVFFISWSAISLPAMMDLISTVVPKSKRTMGVSVQSLIRRVPKTLGPFVGGAFILGFGVEGSATGSFLHRLGGVRLAFVLALLLAVVAMIAQQILIEEDASEKARSKARNAELSPLRLYRQMNPHLRNLLVSDILIRFCERIPDLFVVIWVTQSLMALGQVQDKAAWWFGILSVVENVTAMLIYFPVAWMADQFGKKPFVAITFVFFTLFPLALLLAHSLWVFFPVFVLRGLKEFGEPTRKALIMDLSPEDRKAAMFGLYYLIRDIVVAFAAFGGAVLWLISPNVNLLTAFAFGTLGTIWFVVYGRDVTGPGRGFEPVRT
jgi:MFS family permease